MKKLRSLRKTYKRARGLAVAFGALTASWRSGAELDRLAGTADPACAKLANALRRSRAGQVDRAREVIEAIERQRLELGRSAVPLVETETADSVKFDLGKTVGTVCAKSKGPREATLLHLLLREFGPVNALELGTNLGISSAYQAAALKINERGRLTTLEGSPARTRVAKRLHESLELDNVSYVVGLFTDTLGGVLERSGPIDYAFIDGNHQMRSTLEYFDRIWEHTAEGAVVVFDDIRWSGEMARAWRQLKGDARIRVAVDCWYQGVCVTTRDPSAKDRRGTFLIRL